jgi:hypothetical protein
VQDKQLDVQMYVVAWRKEVGDKRIRTEARVHGVKVPDESVLRLVTQRPSKAVAVDMAGGARHAPTPMQGRRSARLAVGSITLR